MSEEKLNLEELIEKDKIENVYFFLLERTNRKIRQFGQKFLTENDFDLTIDQWIILKKISEQNGISQVDIAETTFKDSPTVTRIIDLLCKKNLTIRKLDEADRRKFNLFLTDEGMNIVKKVLPWAVESRKKGIDGLSQEELQQFKNTLNKIYENLE